MNCAVCHGEWPEVGLSCTVYSHYILGYRYHWHENEYEIHIVLCGKASFYRNGDIFLLEENDVILIDPGMRHASLAIAPDSVVLVLRFPAAVFQNYLEEGRICSFSSCRSDRKSRDEKRYRQLRYHCIQIFYMLNRHFPLSALNAKANMEMLMVVLHRDFWTKTPEEIHLPGAYNQKVIDQVKQYLEQNYTEKITLTELAELTGYHKNYLSNFFKRNTGVNLYTYLTRLRFWGAVKELNLTRKTLTEIAVDNGFAELKLFNHQFKKAFSITPAEYRSQVVNSCEHHTLENDFYFLPSNKLIEDKISEYASTFL